MKTILITFLIMYAIEEIFNLVGYFIAQKRSLIEIDNMSGGICTAKWLYTNWAYADFGDYLAWALKGAILRFVLSPVAMVGIIAIAFETIRKVIKK